MKKTITKLPYGEYRVRTYDENEDENRSYRKPYLFYKRQRSYREGIYPTYAAALNA